MAKMHSRARGHARSHKPLHPTKPTWTRHNTKEIELLVGKLAKEGKTPSEIGLVLRDSYGVPNVKLLTGKRIQEHLKEKELLSPLPYDMQSLIKRAIIQRKHLETNKHDMSALRGLQLTESKVKRLAKYYKKIGRIPPLWKYDSNTIKIHT